MLSTVRNPLWGWVFTVTPPVLPTITLVVATVTPACSPARCVPPSFCPSASEDVEFLPQNPSAHVKFMHTCPERAGAAWEITQQYYRSPFGRRKVNGDMVTVNKYSICG